MRAVALAAVTLCSACVGPLQLLTQSSTVDTGAGDVRVRFMQGADSERTRVAVALTDAAPLFSRWGALEHPVTLWLVPTHQALERAVHRRGYAWLRAWSQYETVYLQTPASWLGAFNSPSDLTELLAHELTHTVMYQRCAQRDDWASKDIPVWFREGMATWTANQGYRFVTLEQLAAFMEQSPVDPILEPDELYQSKSEYVYAAAHHAFTFLVARYGEKRIRSLLDDMRGGHQFSTAFKKAMGVTEVEFAREFRRFVLWRGFRGNAGRAPARSNNVELR